VATSRTTPTVFLHWLALRTAVNGAQLAGLDDVLGQRIDRWAERSYELERDWRGT
jgi:hypothetical protein